MMMTALPNLELESKIEEVQWSELNARWEKVRQESVHISHTGDSPIDFYPHVFVGWSSC